MIKRYISIVLILFLLIGCSKKQENYEIALIIDERQVNDLTYQEDCWLGICDYIENTSIQAKQYSSSLHEQTIDMAIKNGAKFIILYGDEFSEFVYQAQTTYPDVKFVLIDGNMNPNAINENTISIQFKEDQLAFLTGYTLVKSGYTHLGIVHDSLHAYSFLYGVDYAAKTLNCDDIQIRYDSTIETKDDWYQEGIEVIYSSCVQNGCAVYDDDKTKTSNQVLFSTYKDVRNSVYDIIAAYYKNAFPGGTQVRYGVEVDYVGLVLDESKLDSFIINDYEAIYQLMKDETLYSLPNTIDIQDITNDFVRIQWTN